MSRKKRYEILLFTPEGAKCPTFTFAETLEAARERVEETMRKDPHVWEDVTYEIRECAQ